MSFESLLIHTCEIIDQDLDKWGEPSGAETVTVERCRIEYGNKLVRTTAGEQAVSTARVFLRANTVAKASSRIRMDGRDCPILTLKRQDNARRVHHYEAYTG